LNEDFLDAAPARMGTFFLSLTGYVIIAAVSLIVGSTFVMLIHNMGTKPFAMPVTQLFSTVSCIGCW